MGINNMFDTYIINIYLNTLTQSYINLLGRCFLIFFHPSLSFYFYLLVCMFARLTFW